MSPIDYWTEHDHQVSLKKTLVINKTYFIMLVWDTFYIMIVIVDIKCVRLIVTNRLHLRTNQVTRLKFYVYQKYTLVV